MKALCRRIFTKTITDNITGPSSLPLDVQKYILTVSNDWKTILNLMFTSKSLYLYASQNPLILDHITRITVISLSSETDFLLFCLKHSLTAKYKLANVHKSCRITSISKTKALLSFSCGYLEDITHTPPGLLPAGYSIEETHMLEHHCIANDVFKLIHAYDLMMCSDRSKWQAKCNVKKKSFIQILTLFRKNNMKLTESYKEQLYRYLIQQGKMTQLTANSHSLSD